MKNDNLPIQFNLEEFGKLTEPITKLIEVISKGVGRLYEPTHKVKMAEAELKEKVLKDLSEVITKEIQLRGFQFFVSQATKKQINIESKYLPTEISDPNNPDDSWVLDFFDLSQNCTDEEMQELWAKLLADEVDKPGSHSRRVMHFLKILSPTEARFFKYACESRCRIFMRKKNIEKILQTDIVDNEAVIISLNDDVVFGDHLDIRYNYNQMLYMEEIGLFNRIIFWGADDEDGAEIYKLDFNGHELHLKNAIIEVFEFSTLGYGLLQIANPTLDSKFRECVEKKLIEYNMLARR